MYKITDIIIQNDAGIPYIARCYSATECIKNPNHSLVSGFFAALNSFKVEISQNKLKTIGFDATSFFIESIHDLLVIIGVEADEIPEEEIKTIGCLIRDEFIKRHGDHLQGKLMVRQEFDEFVKWMDSILEKENSSDLIPMIQAPKSSNLWSRIKSIF